MKGFAWFLAIVGVFAVLGYMYPDEEETTVKYEDCRKIIHLDKHPSWPLFQTFSCTFERWDGGIVGGNCVRVTTGTFSGVCEVAKVYPVGVRVNPKKGKS